MNNNNLNTEELALTVELREVNEKTYDTEDIAELNSLMEQKRELEARLSQVRLDIVKNYLNSKGD